MGSHSNLYKCSLKFPHVDSLLLLGGIFCTTLRAIISFCHLWKINCIRKFHYGRLQLAVWNYNCFLQNMEVFSVRTVMPVQKVTPLAGNTTVWYQKSPLITWWILIWTSEETRKSLLAIWWLSKLALMLTSVVVASVGSRTGLLKYQHQGKFTHVLYRLVNWKHHKD